jgi:hypothetical protein
VPILLTLIDAEEEFDWSAPFSRAATNVASMAHQGPAHRVFEKFGVVPTYMVDYPVVTQDGGLGPLRDLLRDQRCDIGTQLHAWVTPPFLEQVTNCNSYPGNLPPALEFEKIRCITEKIEDSLGVRPRIYRAGRYGVGVRTADILKALGYQADSSAVPGWDFRPQEGPDFTAWSAVPCWLDADHTILEIPIAAAVTGRMAGSPGLRRATLSGLGERLGMPSLTSRLELLERIKLTPEGITVKEAKRLIRHMLEHGQKVFVLSYHTPSLVPGNTRYVRTQDDLRRFLAWLEEIYSFFTEDVGGTCGKWTDVRDRLLDRSDDTIEAGKLRQTAG